jgi:hypothetical protein
VAALGIPASLLWDFSWECTVGIDLPWAAPHLATYAAVALAGVVAFAGVRLGDPLGFGVSIGRLRAPPGAWVVLWGVLGCATATVFDRWWQSSYGLAAGIWHPPQLLKAVSFFAVVLGSWISVVPRPERHRARAAFTLIGGASMALIFVTTLAASLANRQQSIRFYEIACGVYPIVLTTLATAGGLRFGATAGALVYTAMVAGAVWLLPLIPGVPAVSPIYNPRDHLMPPPFPLLLIAPALAIDLLARPAAERRGGLAHWSNALEAGLAFFLVFMMVQWPFARFLLSPTADNVLFAGGGRHWPFFLKIDEASRTSFWRTPGDELTISRGLLAVALAVVSARLGLWLGIWMKSIRR